MKEKEKAKAMKEKEKAKAMKEKAIKEKAKVKAIKGGEDVSVFYEKRKEIYTDFLALSNIMEKTINFNFKKLLNLLNEYDKNDKYIECDPPILNTIYTDYEELANVLIENYKEYMDVPIIEENNKQNGIINKMVSRASSVFSTKKPLDKQIVILRDMQRTLETIKKSVEQYKRDYDDNTVYSSLSHP